MKALIIAVIAINCMFFSCEKTGGYGPLIEGKLVHLSCASAVIQILDPSEYHLGQASWQQSSSSPVYHHVFAVENICSYRSGKTVNVGDVFRFQLTKTSDNNCAVCQLWDNPPTVTQKIFLK